MGLLHEVLDLFLLEQGEDCREANQLDDLGQSKRTPCPLRLPGTNTIKLLLSNCALNLYYNNQNTIADKSSCCKFDMAKLDKKVL